MTIDESYYKYIAKAVANYYKGRNRIFDTITTIADHIHHDRIHRVDSLMSGSIAAWSAEDAMFEELIVQVLVAIQIVTEHKHEEKYRMIADAEEKARHMAIKAFEQKRKTKKEQ